MHLGTAEQLPTRLQQGRAALRLRSVSAGPWIAAFALAAEGNCAPIINEEVVGAGGPGQRRDGLSVGESLLAAAIARLVRASIKRVIAAWAAETTLAERFSVPAGALTSDHFWDQMDSVPLTVIPRIEQRLPATTREEWTTAPVEAYRQAACPPWPSASLSADRRVRSGSAPPGPRPRRHPRLSPWYPRRWPSQVSKAQELTLA